MKHFSRIHGPNAKRRKRSRKRRATSVSVMVHRSKKKKALLSSPSLPSDFTALDMTNLLTKTYQELTQVSSPIPLLHPLALGQGGNAISSIMTTMPEVTGMVVAPVSYLTPRTGAMGGGNSKLNMKAPITSLVDLGSTVSAPKLLII